MTSGPVLFARYAYPPNALGYCGPDDHRALLEYGSEEVSDWGLVQLARGFEGAWPYLELIAHANGIGDPLDPMVVEAYWVGNHLLDRVDLSALGPFLEEAFRGRAGRTWEELGAAILSSAVAPLPHHNFHVLCVYPWVGLMRAGWSEHPLHVIDRCRIRWGRVVGLDGEHATVRFRPLTWDGREIAFGPPAFERVRIATEGRSFVRDVRPGDHVSMHWDWLCDRLAPRGLAALRRLTRLHLDIVNRASSLAAPPAALR